MGILQFKNVSKRYGEMPVLDNINLDVEMGEFVVILGFSGTGKTTGQPWRSRKPPFRGC